MNIKGTIATINQMQVDRVIGQYAIGGAVAATFYTEPIDTADLDIFITLEAPEGQLLITLDPIYEYLRSRGFPNNDKGDVVIFGSPVQFLPVGGNTLITEALAQSKVFDIDGVAARAFSAEHLAAIALKLGRPKDKIRLPLLLQSTGFNDAAFSSILARHGMTDAWASFKRRFLD